MTLIGSGMGSALWQHITPIASATSARGGGTLRAVGPVERFDQVTAFAGRAILPVLIYLMVTTIANMIAEHTGSRWLARVVRVTTPRFLASLLVGLVATAAPAGAQVESTSPTVTSTSGDMTLSVNDPPVMQVIEDGSAGDGAHEDGSAGDGAHEGGSRHDRSLPWIDAFTSGHEPPSEADHVPDDTTMSNGSVAAPVRDEPDDTPAEPAPGTATGPRESTDGVAILPTDSASTHIVEVGDHFWSIAESVLGRSGVEHVDQLVIAEYWAQLVELNEDRLVQPGNPDLIMPGQRLVLPPIR